MSVTFKKSDGSTVTFEKFNPHHDARGRFTTKGGGSAGAAGGSAAAEAVGELNSLPVARGKKKVAYETIKEYEKVLDKMPVGTKLAHKMEAGTELYEKVNDGKVLQWKYHRMPFKDTVKQSSFDMAHWLAGRGVISRGPVEIYDGNVPD